MTRIVAVTTALVLAASTGARAHRLDEYLQAARVAVASSDIEVHLDLTPGVSVAAEIFALLDADGDGRVSPVEAEAYGRVVLAEVSARLDGEPLGLTLTRVEVPTEGEMRDGVGTIRIEAAAASHAQRLGRTSSSCGTRIGLKPVSIWPMRWRRRTRTFASCDSSATPGSRYTVWNTKCARRSGRPWVAHCRRSGADGARALADTPAT